MAKKNQSNEIKITRIYDAPVKAVWDAWTDPKKAAKWWGPRGFTITTHSKDLKPGGHWHYTMHGPDGVDYPNKTKYFEVENCARLVYDHGGNDEQAPLFRVTATFAEKNGKTTLTMSMALKTVEEATQTRKFIKQAGGNGTWDRLAEFLAEESTGENKFFINRTFDVPLNTMFKMWTDPKHFSQWLAPTGFSMEFIRADIKTGGSSFYFMTNGADVKMYGRAKYLEVKSPDKLVYIQEFCDKDENLSRHPMAPTWPAAMITKVNFVAESEDETRVTIEWMPYGDVTAEELNTFIQGRAGMTQGWTGSFDKLEDYIEKV